MAETVTVEDDTHYHRKSDRSPENPHFHDLPSSDKRLISNMRIAVEGTRSKINKLRDEIDDKDLDVSREAALRKAAEARLEQLVDMYGNPAVMDELRDRLPHAKQPDTKKRWQEELEELRKSEAASMTKQSNTDLVDKTGKKRSRGSRSMDEDSDTEGSEQQPHSPPHSRAHHAGYPPYPMGGYPVPQMAGYPNPPYPGYMPAMYPYPAHQMMAPGAIPPDAVSAAAAAGGNIPMAAGMMPQMMMAVTPQSLFQHAQMTNASNAPDAAATAEQGASPTATTSPGPGDGGIKLAGILSKSSPDLSLAARDASVSREQNRQISMLLKELDAAKDLNERLQHQLTETQHDLERLEITQQTSEAAAKVEMTSQAADLVEQIYRAQKQRDEAILGRLRLANEERDEALLKLRQADREPDGCDDDADGALQELNIPELLSMIEESDSAHDISCHGNKLLNNLTARQERRRLVTTEEMSAVLEERDNAVAQTKQMENELLHVQRQLRGRVPDSQSQATTQAKLLATQQERDLTLSKVRKMEEELQNLRVYYSLHKSLSQEANLRDQFNNTLGTIENQLRERDTVVDATAKENSRMLAQLKALSEDKAQMAAQVEKAQFSQKESQVQCQKLERLVNVLRRKLNGLGSKSDD